MRAYAANTGTIANLDALEAAGWGIMLAPYRPRLHPDYRFNFAIDNGAWPAYTNNTPFDEIGFKRLVNTHGAAADFVVVPDIVGGGMRSLEFSKLWLYSLRGLRRLLLALQDGMDTAQVISLLRDYPDMGLFLGGTTDYKLATIQQWGGVAKAMGRWYHVGRVNTVKRIDLCGQAGATSFDGSSATRYSKTLELLDRTRRKYMCIDELEDWRKASELRAQTAGAAVVTVRAAAIRPRSQQVNNHIAKESHMEVTQEFISRLRRELAGNIQELADADYIGDVLCAFDRAVLSVVLPAASAQPKPVATSAPKPRKGKAASEAARRAWETRRRNKTGAKEPGPVVERVAGAGAVGVGAEGGAA